MADVERFEMPVEARLELGAVVSLDDQNSEGQPLDHLIHKTNC